MMNLKKNAILWAVVLAAVLIGVTVLYVVTRGDKGISALPIPGSYSLDEVRAASTTEKCWTAIEDSVYDMTPFVQGDARLLTLCGTDATSATSVLGEGAAEKFENLRIGSLRR